MYYFLALLSGTVISIMVSINGGLTQLYGIYFAAVIIHIVGVLFSLILCILRKEKLTLKKVAPLWAYLGGVIGVLTTLFNNFAFGRINMTSIVALGLLGQSLTSILFDYFGCLDTQKRPIKKTSLIGLFPAVAGIFLMLDQSITDSFFAVILSLGAGATVVLSRTVNSRLSKETSPLVGSFINHLVGLPICIGLALSLPTEQLTLTSTVNPLIFLGGILGVLTVLLFNITVPKVSAFHLTLLSFIGQLFTGIILDLLQGRSYSTTSFIGGVVIGGGLLLNMGLEYGSNKKSVCG